MTSAAPDDAARPPAWQPLTPEQRRVLGVLIEKAKTTPAAYPMSVNAIVAGCNQKNNRDPVMALDDDAVERVLEELRLLGAAAEAPESTRVAKFRHRGYEWLAVSRAELAIMAELLLRGAQSLGDLRARAARMEPIADLPALKPLVEALVQRGLMIELTAAGRGQIVSHRLYKQPEMEALQAQYAGHVPQRADFDDGEPTRGTVAPGVVGPSPAVAMADERFARLGAEVAELREQIARLREQVRDLEARLLTLSG